MQAGANLLLNMAFVVAARLRSLESNSIVLYIFGNSLLKNGLAKKLQASQM